LSEWLAAYPGLAARVRLFGLLAVLVPLFVGLQQLARDGVPRIEIRFVTQDVPVPLEVPVERVVERVVYEPVERIVYMPVGRTDGVTATEAGDSPASAVMAPADAGPAAEAGVELGAEPAAEPGAEPAAEPGAAEAERADPAGADPGATTILVPSRPAPRTVAASTVAAGPVFADALVVDAGADDEALDGPPQDDAVAPAVPVAEDAVAEAPPAPEPVRIVSHEATTYGSIQTGSMELPVEVSVEVSVMKPVAAEEERPEEPAVGSTDGDQAVEPAQQAQDEAPASQADVPAAPDEAVSELPGDDPVAEAHDQAADAPDEAPAGGSDTVAEAGGPEPVAEGRASQAVQIVLFEGVEVTVEAHARPAAVEAHDEAPAEAEDGLAAGPDTGDAGVAAIQDGEQDGEAVAEAGAETVAESPDEQPVAQASDEQAAGEPAADEPLALARTAEAIDGGPVDDQGAAPAAEAGDESAASTEASTEPQAGPPEPSDSLGVVEVEPEPAE
jgi:hypothetical protein